MIVGLPASSYGDRAIADFINNRGVSSVAHVLGSDSHWGRLGANGMPSWATIRADGQYRSGVGGLPSSVLDGSWTG